MIRSDQNRPRAVIWQPKRMAQRVPDADGRARAFPVAAVYYSVLLTSVYSPRGRVEDSVKRLEA
jgi:hypothetical protein